MTSLEAAEASVDDIDPSRAMSRSLAPTAVESQGRMVLCGELDLGLSSSRRDVVTKNQGGQLGYNGIVGGYGIVAVTREVALGMQPWYGTDARLLAR